MYQGSVLSNYSVGRVYERSKFDTLSRQQWKAYPNLGSVLDAQLVHQGKATRSTQTNWKWRQMAARWRHAKIIEPRLVPISDLGIQRDKRALRERMVKDLKEVRALTSHDKIVDTQDLEFDPNDVPAEYNCQTSLCQKRCTVACARDTIKRYADKWKHYVTFKKDHTRRSVSKSSKPSFKANESSRGSVAVTLDESRGDIDSVSKK